MATGMWLKTHMAITIINAGSVNDIRSSLRHVEKKMTVVELNNNIDAEMKSQCRTSVINMLNAAIKRKMKKK